MTEHFGYSLSLGQRVDELLRDGVMTEIMALVKKELEEDWQRTAPGDVEGRERIYHELHVLSRVQLRFDSIIGSLRMNEGRYNAN